MSRQRPLRLFLDSNVVTGGIVSEWGLDKAVLALCAARICRMVLAEYVREEVEENLLNRAAELSSADADQVIDDYSKLLTLARPEIIPMPVGTGGCALTSFDSARRGCAGSTLCNSGSTGLAAHSQYSALHPYRG